MFRKIVSILFVLTLLSTTAFANTAIIENSGDNRYKSIRLTPEIYNNANSDLSDLRILDANGEYIPFFINSSSQSDHNEAESYFAETLTPNFQTEEKDKKTYIYIEGLKNLRLGEITIETDSVFQRMVEISSFGIRRELHNLSFSDTVNKDTSIPFNRNISREEILTIIIHNGDDHPINILGITIQYYADELVFEGVSEMYTLRFGADSSIRAPIYDIVRYKDEILKNDIDRLEMQNITFEEIQPEPEQYDFRMIFNIVTAVVTVLLGLLIFLKLRNKKGTSR
ncbi:MAG: hypothetical protein LBC73_05845 [Oscillospiraceae bacterium]|jgi:hypothetical protein|nr:hypothetical protein [Oscillospiraceae bacterium]